MYVLTTDFLALLRRTASGVELARMPGLDFVISAMARIGMFSLWVGQEAPTANQTTTVWLQPAQPSWTAEGNVFLYDIDTEGFAPATLVLWTQFLSLVSTSVYNFQSVGTSSATVRNATTLLAVERVNPTTTALMLPALANARQSLRVVDWSAAVGDHEITLDTPDGATIMRRSSWSLFSTVDQLAGITLHPSTDLNGWVIAP